ncbi:MAG TPA: metal-dependent hydrolase [Novosphingobium sp.]|nr:metal-dependent hydrolase [Novosphingobium sp.]
MEQNCAIQVRNNRFLYEFNTASRWWLGGDPIATAWHNALSASFPRGEAYFIESVRACRDDAPPALAAQIDAFIAQEANHSREHRAFNRLAEASGYDLSIIDARLAAFVEEARSPHAILNLVATAALEHFTAILAHDVLTHPQDYAGTPPELLALWHWHAVEEIEHKAVAFDTWQHAARRFSRSTRWKIRCLVMLRVTRNFLRQRTQDTLDLMAQDGITGRRARLRLWRWLLWSPGVLRRITPAWAAWFRPGFHPWDTDDRHLVATFEEGARGSQTTP